jgi:DNA (cytosine-5)-methyltransferase 1
MVPTSTSEALAERPDTGGRNDDWRRADVIAGGFPCQDISVAGRGSGITGERSDLWRWLCGAIRVVRPLYAIVENVAALLGRGMGTVAGDLAEIGYDAEWHCIPASHVGAPHQRDRIWIVAHTPRELPHRGRYAGTRGRAELADGSEDMADTGGNGGRRGEDEHEERRTITGDSGEDVAHPDEPRLQGWLRRSLQERAEQRAAWEGGAPVADASSSEWSQQLHDGSSEGAGIEARVQSQDRGSSCLGDSVSDWLVEPDVGRVADGVPARVDRLKGLGNAVVPQIPEIIGRAIKDYEANRRQEPSLISH